MDTKEFHSLYDLELLDVVSIKDSDQGLSIVIKGENNIDLVGNGFRSEFAETYVNEFLFLGVRCGIDIHDEIGIKDYSFDGKTLRFTANGKEIDIPMCQIRIRQKG